MLYRVSEYTGWGQGWDGEIRGKTGTGTEYKQDQDGNRDNPNRTVILCWISFTDQNALRTTKLETSCIADWKYC